ncbi:MAG: hypothetical protein K9M99_08335 [Candidatus Cloacimonetes bacterium]|nr:hypothetical protein [Candidatus Cloacimonadota bacterium]
MKKMLVFIVLIVINLLYSHPILKRPNEFNKPQSGLVTTGRVFSDANTTKNWLKCWDAFSDRDNNTYYDGDCMTPIGTLSFLDPVWIIDETDDWVAFGEKTNIDMGRDRQEVNLKGWIKKDKLLLWKQSLKNKSYIDRKAMIIYNRKIFESNNGSRIDSDNVNEFKFCSDPDFQNEIDDFAKMFDFYYIYKIQGDGYLLGKDSSKRVGIGKKPETIIGWVHTGRIATWDTRVAIEPNWKFNRLQDENDPLCKYFSDEPSALKYYQGQKFDASHVFIKLVLSEAQEFDFEKGDYTAAYMELINEERYRKPGQWRRYPIIDNSLENETFMIAAYGGISGESRTEEELLRAIEVIIQRLEAMRTINIVYVIDGTSSMGKYFKPVSDGIKESINQIQSEADEANTFKFGAVIYRDISDTGTKHLIEHKRLTNAENISKFLDSTVAGWDKGDNTKEEALNYGINYAVDNILPEEEGQVNIVILIGDTCDNGYGNIELSELQSKLVQKDCWMLAFQVNKGSHSAYSSFIDNNKTLLMDVAQNHYEDMKESITENILNDMGIVHPSWSSSRNVESGYNTYRISNSSVVARLYEPIGNKLSEVYLGDEIKNFVIEVNRNITKIREGLYRMLDGHGLVGKDADKPGKFSSNSADFTQYMLKFIMDSYADNSVLEALTKKNFQYSEECYTITNFKNTLPQDLHKPVILLSWDELNDVYNSFRRIDELGSDDNSTTDVKVEALIESWKELLASFCGDSEVSIENSTFGEMRQKVTGIPINNSWLDDIDINSIDMEIHKDPNTFNVYYGKILYTVNILGDILRDENYPYRFTVKGNNKYYWIDIDLLP